MNSVKSLLKPKQLRQDFVINIVRRKEGKKQKRIAKELEEKQSLLEKSIRKNSRNTNSSIHFSA